MMRAKKLSAGCVVCRHRNGAWRILVLRAYRNWDFPKGTLEPGEAPLAAAMREVKKETALEALEFPWGGDYAETEPYAGGKVARYYLALAPRGEVALRPTPELGRPEHHEFRWVTTRQARRLLPPRLQSVLDWAEAKLAQARSSAPAGR
jgi:8-oxo-dGTP pyrophosphatase MutT (NUDIX family)